MRESRDSSNRISRLTSEEAQDYLKTLKGARYINYRKNWEFCGREQIGLELPLQLNIEVTANCNLVCEMCYRNYNLDLRSGRLSLSDIEMLADQVKELHIPSVWLSGGEPLTHPDIIEILRVFGHANPVDYWMVSNGLLLTEEISNAIIDSGLTWLSISIDAASAEIYKRIRGGNYDVLLRNIESFLKIRSQKKSRLPFLRVSFIKMDQNKEEEGPFREFWKEKADIIDFQTLADYHDLDQFDDSDVNNSSYRCTAPFTLLSVIPNGDIIPCCNGFYGERSSFNIHNTSIKEYWDSDFHKAFASSIKNKNYCNECVKCVKSFLPRK